MKTSLLKPSCLRLCVAVAVVCHYAQAADVSESLSPTYANVAYGPHERNVLDFWQAEGEQAEGDGPRPLLVFIHGGGWTGGDKQRKTVDVLPYLERGISYAAINYRYSTQAPLPAPVHDAARAIQFLRTKAEPWQIDTARMALTGGSAGACTSMWLLLHDDLADQQAEDPVLRESTRVCAAAALSGQTSLDPQVIEPWLGPAVLQHRMIHLSVGEPSLDEAMKNYEQHRATYAEFAPYNHVDAHDPPLLMIYGQDMTIPSKNASHGIHHPMYGVKLKEKSDRVGHECHLLIGDDQTRSQYASPRDFLLDKLLAPH